MPLTVVFYYCDIRYEVDCDGGHLTRWNDFRRFLANKCGIWAPYASFDDGGDGQAAWDGMVLDAFEAGRRGQEVTR